VTIALLAVLSGLALVDALNPFTIAAQAYLLGTPRPMRRSIAFLLGTFATYLAGGLVLLLGWSAFVAQVLPLLPGWAIPAGEVLLGVGALVLGVWSLRKAAAGTPFAPPTDLSVRATLGFAVASTVADLTSALPYFGAISQIEAADLDDWAIGLALGWYNLLYCAPLVVLIIARAALSEDASTLFFGRMRQAIDWAFAKLLPPLLIFVGAGFAFDGIRRLVM
jgi:hypothetical protein